MISYNTKTRVTSGIIRYRPGDEEAVVDEQLKQGLDRADHPLLVPSAAFTYSLQRLIRHQFKIRHGLVAVAAGSSLDDMRYQDEHGNALRPTITDFGDMSRHLVTVQENSLYERELIIRMPVCLQRCLSIMKQLAESRGLVLDNDFFEHRIDNMTQMCAYEVEVCNNNERRIGLYLSAVCSPKSNSLAALVTDIDAQYLALQPDGTD